MRLFIIYIIWLGGLMFNGNDEASIEAEEVCVSEAEMELYELINAYRSKKGLSTIPLSSALTRVSQFHVKDLMDHYKQSNRCNPHSWSRKGDWTSCCYTSDHKKAECMWNKPREISGYKSPGYEIAFWHSAAATPDAALLGWQNSPGHHALVINKGQWKRLTWQAMGVGIYREYSVVWFGELEDEAIPEVCN